MINIGGSILRCDEIMIKIKRNLWSRKEKLNKSQGNAPDGNLEHHLFEVISACSGIQGNGHF